jgi:hypothetical protein
MQCKTFHLRIREDRIEEYDEAHPHVWQSFLWSYKVLAFRLLHLSARSRVVSLSPGFGLQ